MPARAAPRLLGCSCDELERTRFGPQIVVKTFTVSVRCTSRNRKTGHVLVLTPDAKKPTISVVETGYVRSCEIRVYRSTGAELVGAGFGCFRRLLSHGGVSP